MLPVVGRRCGGLGVEGGGREGHGGECGSAWGGRVDGWEAAGICVGSLRRLDWALVVAFAVCICSCVAVQVCVQGVPGS